MSGLTNNRILWTDAPWSDTGVEQAIFDHAGLEFIRAPSDADLDQIVAKVDPAAIMTCWAAISGETIRQAHDLKVISRLGAGVDNVAVDAATERGVWVTNVPDYCVGEVSDHAIALMLAHFRGILRLDAQVKSNGWQPNGAGLERISDLTVGIIGLGRIGSETARKLKAFGCHVLAVTRSRTDRCDLAEPVDLDTIAARSHVIILHLPMSAQTVGMVGTGFFSKCEKRPLIINVSRGGLVDNDALVAALDTGMIRGAALDVVDGEPSPPTCVTSRKDVIVTPHVAYASDAAMLELRSRACNEVVRVLQGERPHNPYNTIR